MMVEMELIALMAMLDITLNSVTLAIMVTSFRPAAVSSCEFLK